MLTVDHLLTRDPTTLAKALAQALQPPMPLDLSVRITRTAITTLLVLLPVLALFLLRRPAALQTGMWAQVALHGFPVVFLLNLTMSLIYASHLDRLRRQRPAQHLIVLISDALIRIALLMGLTALSFMLWALIKGSFAGSLSSALGAVVTSVRFGLRFESLTGVYLYAAGLYALPVFAVFYLPTLAQTTPARYLVATLATLLPLARLPAVSTLLMYCLGAGAVLSVSYVLLGLIE